MRVAYYPPNEFHELFLPHAAGTEFLVDRCDGDVDFVYAASLSTLERAGAAARTFRKPLVAWIWDTPYDYHDHLERLAQKPSDPPHWWNRYLVDIEREVDDTGGKNQTLARWVDSNRCSLLLCGNPFVRKCLKARADFFDPVPYAVDWMPFYIDQDTLVARPRRSDLIFEVVQISRLAPHKNLECAVEALVRGGADLARATGKTVRLTTIGFTTRNLDYAEKLMYHAKKRLKVDNRVVAEFKLNAERDEIAEALARADAFVSASLHEGFGVPAAEAAYMGVPLVLADRPWYRTQYGNCARYFDPNDPSGLAAALAATARAPNEVCVLRNRHAVAGLNPRAFAERWRARIDRWMDNERRP